MSESSLPAEKYRVAEEDRQELRFAAVMTGGVSLAVWIGGAAHELNRLVRSDKDVYADLLDLTGTTARVDVIAGTSAGGLNGALLAMAQVHDSDLTDVRRLWLEMGELERLLRSPADKNPPSLMRGDDYLLPGIRKALKALENRPLDQLTPARDVPVHLIITSTLLAGQHRGIPDSFGSVIPDLDHRGEFTFRRGRGQRHHVPEGCAHPKGKDDDTGDDWAEPDTLARLALAARSTASFPFAFEPSFCPVGEAADAAHPDMACHANFPVSRWAIDGGVLVNRPLRPALEAIFAQEATRQVRRVLAYLVPDPGVEQQDLPDDRATFPTLAQVAYASLLSLPRNQSVFSELDRIREHNERVAGQRRRRQAAVETQDALLPLARRLYARYRRVRAEHVADSFLDLIAHGAVATSESRKPGAMPLWDRSALRGPFIERLSIVPPETFPAADAPIERWFTTLGAVERAGALALDLLGRPLKLTNPLGESSSPEDRKALRGLRGTVHDALRDARGRARPLMPAERQRLAKDTLEAFEDGTLADRAQELVTRLLGDPDELRGDLERIAGAIRRGAPIALGMCDASAGEERTPSEPIEEARTLARAFVTPDLTVDGVLWRMLALEVVQVTLADLPPSVEQAVEVLQLSAAVGNGFDARAAPEEKLAGLQLGHFGAFYKRSWRANDWMWGRLDAAQRLTQVLLDPPRLRQLGYTVDDALARISAIAFDGLSAADAETLRTSQPFAWDLDLARRELGFLARPGTRPPASLPICARAVARRLQLGILQEELVWIADSVAYDEQVGGKSADAELWARQVHKATEQGKSPPAKDVVELFKECAVGQERVAYDGSALLARTSSRTTAVAASALSGTSSGLGERGLKLRRGIRGIALALYLLVLNAMVGTRIGAVTVVGAMAAAAALLAAGLLAGHGLLVTIGGGLLLAGLGVAALRLRWRWGLVLLILTGLVAAVPRILFETTDWLSDDVMDWLEIPWVIFWVVVGAAVLGSLSVVWPPDDGSAATTSPKAANPT